MLSFRLVSIPSRNTSAEKIQSNQRTFFVDSSTFGKRALLQSERMAMLLIAVLFHYRDFHYRDQGEYKLHAFVVMRNHFHALFTLDADTTIERAVQKIKGGFSYRARKELGIKGVIWQRGFSDQRVGNREKFLACRKYIHENPVRAGMANTPEEFPFSSANAAFRKTRG